MRLVPLRDLSRRRSAGGLARPEHDLVEDDDAGGEEKRDRRPDDQTIERRCPALATRGADIRTGHALSPTDVRVVRQGPRTYGRSTAVAPGQRTANLSIADLHLSGSGANSPTSP
ncbi:hypothetical protein GCM10022242_33080 [Nocardioides panacisoli]|uniref:Uncharacterized protein n=1 Tax=Nocardioides panacisoli TaxID=627624 RepID=A0ABP7IY47_9ACTN